MSTLLLLAAAGGAYWGVSILPIYSDKWDIRQEARAKAAQIMAQSATPDSAKQDIITAADRLGVVLRRGDINVDVLRGKCVITVTYTAKWKLKFTKPWREQLMTFTVEAVNLGAM